MTAENPIVDEIRAALDAPPAAGAADLEHLEHTLTSGYAAALSLEAERLRVERRIGEIAAALGRGDDARVPDELAGLGARLAAAETALSHLREMLATLRARADALRAVA